MLAITHGDEVCYPNNKRVRIHNTIALEYVVAFYRYHYQNLI
jgi:hypothetical protein